MSPVAPGSTLDQPTQHDGPNLKKLDQGALGFGTRAVHVGSEPDPSTGAIIPAISLSTTYKQEDIGRNKVDLDRPETGIVYANGAGDCYLIRGSYTRVRGTPIDTRLNER